MEAIHDMCAGPVLITLVGISDKRIVVLLAEHPAASEVIFHSRAINRCVLLRPIYKEHVIALSPPSRRVPLNGENDSDKLTGPGRVHKIVVVLAVNVDGKNNYNFMHATGTGQFVGVDMI